MGGPAGGPGGVAGPGGDPRPRPPRLHRFGHREHPRGLRRRPPAGGRRGRARRPPQRRRRPGGPPRPGDPRRRAGGRARGPRPAGRGAAPRPTPWRSARGWWSTSRSRTRPASRATTPTRRSSVATAAAIVECGWAERVIVSSFHRPSLDAVRSADPAWPSAGSSGRPPTPRALEPAAAGRLPGAPPLRDRGRRRRWSSGPTPAGLAVNVWTVNARGDLRDDGGPRGGRRHHRPAPAEALAGGPGRLSLGSLRGGRRDPGWRPGARRSQQCMAMNVVVCVKQIPDPAAPGSLDPTTHTLVRSGKLILDDSDAYGVEMALQLADRRRQRGDPGLDGPQRRDLRPAHGPGHGGRQGHPGQRRRPGRLRRPGHGQGPGRGDRAGPSPTWSSRPPSRPTATPAPCRCRWPSCWACPRSPSPRGGRRRQDVKVERQTEAGYDEVECPLPAVVTVTAGVVEPRYPSFKGIMAAKSKPVDTLTVADLGHRRLPGRRGRCPPGDHRRVGGRGPRRPGRSWWTRATAPQRIVAFLEQIKVI